MNAELRQRVKPTLEPVPAPNLVAGATSTVQLDGKTAHPSGKEKHSRLTQLLRGLSFGIFFITSAITIQLTQWIGAPLYWVSRDLFYDYMAVTKQSFGLVITTMTYWWGPTTIRISGDASVAGQIKKTRDGRVEFSFPERLIMIANHQIYTDWLYLWWVGYANSPRMHGYIYIILKESLKYLPVIGPGMMFYGFIFMSRKMAIDQPRMAHRLQKLRTVHTDPSGRSYLNPMWLLLFPEGTNTSGNGRVKSAKWAEKMGYKDTEHVLLPRSTGMYFCLKELKGSVEYIYDCTVAYEGIPRGKYGEEYFTLSGTYFQGQAPKSVNFHWRRFRVDDIPLETAEVFDQWLRDRWYEKDAMMETYLTTGRLPASPQATSPGEADYIETEVRTRYPWEIFQVFSVVSTVWVLYRLFTMYWR
ncbi:Phospholipid/glycerol acyltransferase [Niveomyces insectorum RCEF 264]|uniref:Phospholipid/glycerol acyltransferase n=1 Tax=Niveomyces insectorum RCEF 264 TaxID=1081102 RepID=A0A167XZW2_9HYPO|nr:Phospholipid/glycerol acyltransferase [Niveomyces insectorum RCEF 264]